MKSQFEKVVLDHHEFEKMFRYQCETTRFRQEIKYLISEQTNFWQINEMVRIAISKEMPQQTDNIVIPRVIGKLNKFVIEDLPDLTNKQLKIHVNNDSKMKEILEKNRAELTAELITVANQIMTKVVNEPQYHELSKLHFSEIDKKMGKKFDDFNRKIDDKLLNSLHDLNRLSAKMVKLERTNQHLIIAIVLLSITFATSLYLSRTRE